MAIKFYKTKEPYGFMNNYYKARFYIYGRWFNDVETAYQSQKTNVISEKEAIWQCTKPNDARLLGQKVSMVSDWDQIKREVMKECCLAKFLQHSDLRFQLMDTGTQDLVEDSKIDFFWGCGADG